MSWEQRNEAFSKAQTDAQMAYIEAEREVRGLQAENAKLREELAKARDPQRIGGQADPSSFAYAIEQLREFRWQHATNDEDAIPYINNVAAAHERENAKLRGLVRKVERFERIGCYECPYAGCGADTLYDDDCPMRQEIKDEMRALGIEVVDAS